MLQRNKLGDFDTAKQKAIFRFAEKKGSEALANETAQTLRKWKKAT